MLIAKFPSEIEKRLIEIMIEIEKYTIDICTIITMQSEQFPNQLRQYVPFVVQVRMDIRQYVCHVIISNIVV